MTIKTDNANKEPGVGEAARPVPGPKRSFLLGNLPGLMRKGLYRLIVDGWRESGDIFSLKMGPMSQVILTKPEHIKYLLATNKQNYSKGKGYQTLRDSVVGNSILTSDGEFWQHQRKLIQPLFTARAVTQYADVMTSSAQEMEARWQPYAEQGKTVDISIEMMQLAMSIIGKTMLSLDVADDAMEIGRSFRIVLKYISKLGSGMMLIPPSFPTPENRRYRAAVRFLNTFIYEQIRKRRTEQERPADLLTRLIEVRDEETGEGMSDQQIHDEVLTIFFAGHETTALVLTWAWYLLATHPEAERKLHEELAAVLDGRKPVVGDLPNLPYTRMVFEETMRLYPPAWIFPRDAIKDDEIGGYHVPAGTMVLSCPYLTHRNPDIWEQPEKFEPERFTADSPPYTYYPFGAGSRTCLGNHFAMLEGQLILATMTQHYQLRPVPGFVPEPVAHGTLRLPHGLPMKLHAR